jgi:hypothetical protein
MVDRERVSMPGRLIGVLVVLFIQVLGNGFLGWAAIDELDTRASHGARVNGAVVAYFVGYLSLVIAVALLVCCVLTVRPMPWVRPVIITIEGIAVVGGIVNLVNGAVAALLGIVIAIAIIATLMSDEVVKWYQR